MISGLAPDRNRRPPTALLLAEGLETIATQMEAAGTSSELANGRVGTPPSPRTELPGSSEITLSELPPATAVDPSPFPPPGFEPASPYPAPVGPPALQSSPQALAGRPFSLQDPHATSQLTSPPPKALTASRPVSYYILLGVSALALFAISMFLTILVLR